MCIANGISQLLGPIAQVKRNTKNYSGNLSPRLPPTSTIPHVPIQMPVYKEGIRAVIEPTIRSLKAAMSTFEMQCGTANIFINHDGIQLISDDDARERQDFYDENNIGWVAGPKHNPKASEDDEGTQRNLTLVCNTRRCLYGRGQQRKVLVGKYSRRGFRYVTTPSSSRLLYPLRCLHRYD